HGVRLPAALALVGKALAQMQLTAAELDPGLDPFSVVGGFVAKNVLTRVRTSADPKRIFYEAQKLEGRANALVGAVGRRAGGVRRQERADARAPERRPEADLLRGAEARGSGERARRGDRADRGGAARRTHAARTQRGAPAPRAPL